MAPVQLHPKTTTQQPRPRAISILCLAFALGLFLSLVVTMTLWAYSTLAVATSLLAKPAKAIDGGWHAPAASKVNNLTEALHGQGVYGFIFNSSHTPDDKYGVYNWCNMPHVRKQEYVKASDEYKLQYVEVVSSTKTSNGGEGVISLNIELLPNLPFFFFFFLDSSTPQTHSIRIQCIPHGVVPVEL